LVIIPELKALVTTTCASHLDLNLEIDSEG